MVFAPRPVNSIVRCLRTVNDLLLINVFLDDVMPIEFIVNFGGEKMERNWLLSRTGAALKYCFAMVLVFTACFASYAQKTKPSGARKPTVLVLATSHMNNPGRDVLNVQWDDVLTEKRQKEMPEFVNLLKRFKPTKIAVEADFESVKLEEKYNQYLRGKYQLTRNEIDQIGFRLAKELNHQKIYSIDAEGAFDIGRVFEFAKANNQQEIVDKAFAIAKRQVEEINKLIPTATITQIHKIINDGRKIDEGHQVYMMMLLIGKDKEYPGVDLNADWYKRNLTIFSNLTRITESRDDRILVIFGAGHAKLLQQFIEDSGEYNLEKGSKYF